MIRGADGVASVTRLDCWFFASLLPREPPDGRPACLPACRRKLGGERVSEDSRCSAVAPSDEWAWRTRGEGQTELGPRTSWSVARSVRRLLACLLACWSLSQVPKGVARAKCKPRVRLLAGLGLRLLETECGIVETSVQDEQIVMKREILDKMRMASHRFTIEQFELLRRLRASGITKDEVVLAFENFDRVEWELQVGRNMQGILRNSNGGRLSVSSTSPPQVNGGRMPLHVRDQDRTLSSEKEHHHHPNGNGTNGEHNGRPKSSAQSTGACSVSSNEDSSATEGREQMTPPLRLTNKTPPPHRGSTDSSSLLPSMLGATDTDSIQAAAAQLFASLPLMGTPHTPHTPTSIPNNQLAVVSPQTPVSWSGDSGSMVPYLPDDYCSPDVEKLKRKGEEALVLEIRNFAMQYNIKQTMIAEMTKMSQAYVSRFFRGEIHDMSERTRNTFYHWYLTCKNNPLKYAAYPGVKRMVSENGDLIPLKRERFTFKSAHLAVLERHYEHDAYPDSGTREQIVEECNAAVERPDRPLSDREKVTLPVVNNWFNNRRKEAKKQMRQQHAVAQQEAATAPAFAAAAALHAMHGWQQQLLQNPLSVFAGAASQPGASPPPQPQPSSLQPPIDEDDSRGSYSIPEEAMAIDFSEGGAAAREREASKVNELKIKQEAVS